MKSFKSYIMAALALAAGAFALPSCQDHFDEPAADRVPVATMKPNTTIAELKDFLWKEEANYCETVYTREYYEAPAGTSAEELERLKTEGTHIIIKGRVSSSDYAGNVFRFIVLQDTYATGDDAGISLNFSIYSYNLYLTYRRGQEIVVDLTGLHAGKYNGLFQVGAPSFNQAINADETSFVAPEIFNRARELDGMPDPAAVDTVEMENFNEISETTAGLKKWQSRLVRFNNVEFVIPSVESVGIETLATYHETVNQEIRDVNGNKLIVRTSGYANFWNTKMPKGKGDVIALLGYYKSNPNSSDSGWQLTLIDINSLQFGSMEETPGTEKKPYTVDQAIGTIIDGSEPVTGWTRGYIVGTVREEIEKVASSSDIDFSDSPVLGNTLVIGQTPESTELEHLLVVTLPQGSALHAQSLRANPANYHKQIDIRGTFVRNAKTFDTYGIVDNDGTDQEFRIEGVTPGPDTPAVDGDGTKESPYTCAQVIALNPPSKETPLETGKWVKGYIVGVFNFDNKDNQWEFSGTVTVNSNVIMADSPDVTSANQIIAVKLSGDVRDALNLVAHPDNYKKQVAVYGDVQKYCGKPGMQNVTQYVLDGQQGGDTPVTPPAGALVLLKASDSDGLAGWTIDNVKLATGVTKVWSWAEYNGKHYANATAYKGVGDTESWLISPVLDMTAVTSVTAQFNQALKFQTTAKELCGFYVRPVGGTWTKIEIPVWPPKDDKWTWTLSSEMNLSAFAGKKVQVAFKYAGSSAGSDQWEVSDLTFTPAGGAIVVEGGSTPTPDPGPTPDPTPGPSDQGGTSGTFNFADPTSLTPSYSEADQVADGTTGNFKIDVKDVSFTSASAAISNTGSGTAARLYHQPAKDQYADKWTYRFYKNTVTTIAVAAGYHITKIEFVPATTAYATAMGSAKFSSGSYADKVWTPSGDVSSVTITPSATIGWSSVTVHYAK